eukprot:3075499-Amphidinium_carterae.1
MFNSVITVDLQLPYSAVGVHTSGQDSQDEGTDDGINVDVGMHKKGASAPGSKFDSACNEKTTPSSGVQALMEGPLPCFAGGAICEGVCRTGLSQCLG